MDELREHTVHGTFFHAPEKGRVEVLEDALLHIDAQGFITDVTLPSDPSHAERLRASASRLISLPKGCFVLPGFVDCHVHAPQYAQLGQALDEPLEVWLQKYTFPLEARFADLAFAHERYEVLVQDLLALGTTTALYFATVHLPATKLLADLCIAQGQRALVGKVVMDDPRSCPEYYRDPSVESALTETRALIEHVRAHPGNTEGRVSTVITPRFIPSCTDAALEGLGALAAESGCHVQTHCSESDWAHRYALERFGRTDAESLDRFRLLTRRTLLAHGNLLTPGDMELLERRGSAVAHCALSNMYFANAVFPLRTALEKGLHVGLGTDISGGPAASMFDACRASVQASRVLEDGVDPSRRPEERGRPHSRLDIATAFHLATAGGGEALELPVGRFERGYQFDALLIDPSRPAGTIRLFGETRPAALLEKILYTASKPNITAVWVGGRRVSGAHGLPT